MPDVRPRRWRPRDNRRRHKPTRRFPAEVLSDEGGWVLTHACGLYRPTAIRNCALIAVLCRSGLRNTYAAQLRAEGVDMGIISRQLGHASIATTAQYLDHVAPVLLIEVISRRHW